MPHTPDPDGLDVDSPDEAWDEADDETEVECLPEIDDEPEPDLRDFYFEDDEGES